IVLREPSVVAVQEGTSRVLAVGEEAKRMLGALGNGFSALGADPTRRRSGLCGLGRGLELRGADLGDGQAAARTEHVAHGDGCAATRALEVGGCLLGGYGQGLDLGNLLLELGALLVQLGDAGIERLTALRHGWVVTRDLVKRGSQLGCERLALLEKVAHLDLELGGLGGTTHGVEPSAPCVGNIVKESHVSPQCPDGLHLTETAE
ncbi:MAG: rod shape-determining protein, partial [Atopobiaceae bacterium]|nr:rod shape-determining protein [Atopobiaceae bacterium]